MGFKLNIGKDGGGGSTGFSLKQSLNMIKAKGMSSQMVGTDVMKDGYYNTVNESGAGSPSNFNAGLRKASASGKLDDNPKFKAAVDASGEGMPMNEMAYKNDDSSMYKRSCFNVNEDSPATKREKTASEIKKRGVDLRTGGQLVPTRGDLTPEQNREVLKKSVPADIDSGKRRKFTDQDKAQMANTGNLLGSAQAATNELERTLRS